MNVAVTMYTSDRIYIQSAAQIIELAISQLDGIEDSNLGGVRDTIARCILSLTMVRDDLNRVNAEAVTYQFRPGENRP